MNRIKRSLCLLLASAMLAGYLPGALSVSAAQEDGLCQIHHAAHDESVCGYAEAVEGVPCGHMHEQTCYVLVQCCHSCTEECEDPCAHECTVDSGCVKMELDCRHDHDDACGYTEGTAEVPCGHVHSEDCGYAAAVEAVPCGHSCADQGCAMNEDGESYTCLHTEHEESCGYTEAVEGSPCSHTEHGDCGYMPAVEGTPCTHTHSVKVGRDDSCYKKLCSHAEEGQHDDVCGFVAAVEAKNCSFAGSECAQCADVQAAADAQENQLYGCIDGTFVTEMTVAKGDIGPNMTFLASEESEACLETVVSSNPGIAALRQDGITYQICGMETGETVLTYTDDENNVYTMAVTVEDRALIAQPEGSPNRGPRLTMQIGQERNVAFYLYADNFWADAVGGAFASSNEEIFTVWDYSEPQHVCRLSAKAAGTADVIFTAASGAVFALPVTVEEAMLAKVGEDTFDELYFTTGAETQVQFYLSGSEEPLTGLQAESSVISLTAGENGVYTLKALRQGVTGVVYEDDTGKKYTVRVSVTDPVVTGGYLYHYGSDDMGNNYPITCEELQLDMEFSRQFFFGDLPIRMDDPNFSFSGPIAVEDYGDGFLGITATGIGTGYLEYRSKDSEDGPVITNCFVINVTEDGEGRPSGTERGSYMYFGDTVIGFGDIGRSPENAEFMILDHEVKGAFDDNDNQERYSEKALLAAIKSNGQPDMDLIRNSIDNVKFSVLSAVYRDTTPAAEDKLHPTETVWHDIDSAAGVGTWMTAFEAKGRLQFYAKLGMQFDLEDGEEIRRISLFTHSHNVFMGNEVRVVAHDIDSAAKLNVILSSRESLLNWIADKVANGTGHPDDTSLEYASQVANIVVVLPKADLTDTVVVSQTIADIPYVDNPISTPDFRIMLEGQGSNKTKLAGLINKGSLFGVVNIGFEADPSVTMTRDGATFTCGILADPEWNGTVVYDPGYMAKYGERSGERTLDQWNNSLKDWHCDVTSLMFCSFDGFDYGTYSTDNGYVGTGMGNQFENCYYGIYIDSADKSGWVNLKAGSDYSGYRFHKNVYAVRIKGLQQNMSPYDFRIHDSDFINNYIEFAIDDYSDTYLQNYYFYRNHYRGNWNGKTTGWVEHKTAPSGGSDNAPHRGPRYEVLGKNGAVVSNGGNVKISGTPGKATANLESRSGGEGYWIYGDANQLTRIMAGEKLPIAQEALDGLNDDAEVSVVSGDGTDTIAVWTFEGGE